MSPICAQTGAFSVQPELAKKPKLTKKQQIAALKYRLCTRDLKIQQLTASLQESDASHAKKNERIAELERELEHQRARVEPSQARSLRAVEAEAAHWQERYREGLRGASAESLLAELARRIES